MAVAVRGDERPIGVFDSGVGGLSVTRALLAQLEREAVYYVADSLHCPYGARSPEEIRRLSAGIARHLIRAGCKLIVVACNTASAAALAHLRASFPDTPFVGMVPAVKPAAQRTRSGVLGVLATAGTLNGYLYGEVVEHYAEGVRVVAHACPGLVELVEQGELEGAETERVLRTCVEPMLAAGADTLVLGCTHYPFLIPTLQRIVGPSVALVEPSEAVAQQTARVLEREGLARQASEPPQHRFATSGEAEQLSAALKHLLGRSELAQHVIWCGDELLAAEEGQ